MIIKIDYDSLTVETGVSFLYDTEENLKTAIKNILNYNFVDDKYLYIVEMSAGEFIKYYQAVCERCDEINILFYNNSGINEAVVRPKIMFLFEDTESCNHFVEYFEKIDDLNERVRNELIYGSTDSVVMKLSIPHSLLL